MSYVSIMLRSMSNQIDVQPFEDDMWRAAAVLDSKREQMRALEVELQDARDVVDCAMQRYGAALSIDGRTISREAVRALYWEHGDVRADSIARAFAIKGGAGQVHRYAGTEHVDFPCPGGCGRPVRLTARTAAVRSCSACVTATEERRARDLAAHLVRVREQRVEREAWIRSELSKGRSSGDLYAEMVGQYETNGSLPLLQQLEAEIRGIAMPSE